VVRSAWCRTRVLQITAGQVDFDWILRRLQDLGYPGDFSIEYLEMEGVDLGDDVRR